MQVGMEADQQITRNEAKHHKPTNEPRRSLSTNNTRDLRQHHVDMKDVTNGSA